MTGILKAFIFLGIARKAFCQEVGGILNSQGESVEGAENSVFFQSLDCSFDTSLCAWFNDPTDHFDWILGDSVKVDAWHSIPRTLNGGEVPLSFQGQM